MYKNVCAHTHTRAHTHTQVGHTMTVYGALLVGGTGFLTETTPTYPDAGRYWDMTQRHRFTQVSRLPCRVQG